MYSDRRTPGGKETMKLLTRLINTLRVKIALLHCIVGVHSLIEKENGFQTSVFICKHCRYKETYYYAER